MRWKSGGFWRKSGIWTKMRAGGNRDEKREIPAQKAGMGGLPITPPLHPIGQLNLGINDTLTINHRLSVLVLVIYAIWHEKPHSRFKLVIVLPLRGAIVPPNKEMGQNDLKQFCSSSCALQLRASHLYEIPYPRYPKQRKPHFFTQKIDFFSHNGTFASI